MKPDLVFDLGEVDDAITPVASPSGTRQPLPRPSTRPQTGNSAAQAARAARRSSPASPARTTWSVPVLVPASVAMLFPGGGHLLQARLKAGMVWLGTAVTLGSGIALVWLMFPRLWAALPVMGLPAEATVWTLAALLGLLAAVHVTSALSVRAQPSNDRAAHPAVVCVASGLFPGWGQVLNGDLVRAGVFLAGVWLTAAAWLLASAPFQELMAQYQLQLPPLLDPLITAETRWAATAALWPLAIYDAGASAVMARR